MTKSPKQITQQLSSRTETKNISIFLEKKNAAELKNSTLVLTSPSDCGVMRNGGRQGAHLGPKVILNELSKFQHQSHGQKQIIIEQVTDMDEEKNDFVAAQVNQSKRISSITKTFQGQPIIHLGGGHDHIFPFLMGLQENFAKLNIINIDAHLDTRQDQAPHSGTPFRQFDLQGKESFELHQFGIQQEANHSTNYGALKNGTMKIHETNGHLERVIKQGHDWLNILSIDVDVLSSADFNSCSAVNPCGISDASLNEMIDNYIKSCPHQPVIGFYEYNPIYDNVSNSDAKKLAWKINMAMKKAQ